MASREINTFLTGGIIGKGFGVTVCNTASSVRSRDPTGR